MATNLELVILGSYEIVQEYIRAIECRAYPKHGREIYRAGCHHRDVALVTQDCIQVVHNVT